MNTGKYFEVDKESKCIDNKIHVFNYLRYKNLNPCNACGEKIQPEYPIYAVFTKEGVHFYLHTCNLDNNKISHYSGCILSLPITLDKDFHNELTTILNIGYGLNIKDSVIFRNEEIKDDFGFNIKNFENNKDNINDKVKETVHIGQLILDFMFDMEHSSVFKHSSLYNKIYSCFHEHHLYDAISTKAEYVFYKSYCNSNNGDIYAHDLYSRIERKWVEIIINHKSEYLFHESPWFNDVTDEMNAIYESNVSCLDMYEYIKNDKQNNVDRIKNRITTTSEISRDWYMSKYGLDSVLRIRYGNQFYKTVLWCGISIPIILSATIIMVSIMVNLPQLCLLSLLPMVMALLFYLIPKIFVKRSLFNGKTYFNILMPRLFAGICAGWMTIGLSSIMNYKYIEYIIPSLLCTLLITFLFTMYSVRKELPFENKWRISHISLLIISKSVVYSIISGYCLLKIYEAGACESFNPFYCACDAKTLLLFSSLSMFVGVFINLLFHNKSISSYE